MLCAALVNALTLLLIESLADYLPRHAKTLAFACALVVVLSFWPRG